jgi:uroporphyrinogen-III synthase
LSGRSVLVTSPSSSVSNALRNLGAVVIEVPTVEIVPVEDPAQLAAALRALRPDDWVAFSSVHGVMAVAARLEAEPDILDVGVKIAVVGPSTAEAVGEFLSPWPTHLCPRVGSGRGGLAAAFAAEDLHGRLVLLPLSSLAPPTLTKALAQQGAEVLPVVAYQAVMPDWAAERLKHALSVVEVATFASSSAVDHYFELVGEAGRPVPAIVIGPETRATAERRGLRVVGMATEPSAQSLAGAVARYLAAAAKQS